MSLLQPAAAPSVAVSVTSSMNSFSAQASESCVPSSRAAASSAAALPVIGLDTLAPQQAARVVDLSSADGEDETLLLRLMEIGFLPGESVRIVATGFPGPDPLAVRVGQATFALRRHEAAKVLVQLEVAA